MLISPTFNAAIHPRKGLLRQSLNRGIDTESLARSEIRRSGEVRKCFCGPLHQHSREVARLLFGFGLEVNDLARVVVVMQL